ncbi:MAG: glycosyltransferase family 2 protein, partial [Bacteroidetes bacterium]|nr:glycosyltransferase family 2 protein [Bacteroidota bacterium]
MQSDQMQNPSNRNVALSVVIVNYNLAREIENCLTSLLQVIEMMKNIEYEIIIVDNNSPDRNIVQTENKSRKDNIHFYYLEENLGFGKGCNYGFTKASGKYIWFLNPDTIIKEDIFSQIISQFEQDKSIGIIGPKQQFSKPCFDFSAGFSPNILFEIFNLLGIGVFFEGVSIFLYSKFGKGDFLRVNWILGASIFIRSEMFKEINGFDRDYFMFFEEVDLCKRVANKGFDIVYYPQVEIHHIGSVSGKKDYRLYTIRTYASKFIYISKHYKSFYKYVMKFLLFAQLVSQIFIWS